MLEIYGTEKEAAKKSSGGMRGQVALGTATRVQVAADKPRAFCVYFCNGATHHFEAKSTTDCDGWLFALNAVLFARGLGGSKYLSVYFCWDKRFKIPTVCVVVEFVYDEMRNPGWDFWYIKPIPGFTLY